MGFDVHMTSVEQITTATRIGTDPRIRESLVPRILAKKRPVPGSEDKTGPEQSAKKANP